MRKLQGKGNKKEILLFCGMAFIIPLIILLAVMWYQNIWPMGENTMLVWDMQIQYIDYYSWFHDVLHGEASILYDFSKSLGGNMYGIYAMRMVSPINLLVYFFPKEQMTDFVTITTLLKICLSGLFAEFFLLKRFKNANRWLTVLGAVSFALMEYNVGLCSNLHFLDLIYTLPLVALGVYLFITEKRRALLCLSIGYCVLCNWYIAYSVCAFAVFYYIYESFLIKNGDRIRTVITRFLKFMGWVLTGVMLGGVSMIPSVMASSNGKGELDLDYLLSGGFHTDLLAALKSMLLSSTANSGYDSPAIYVGGFVVAVVLLGFFDRRIQKRTKIASLVFLLLVYLSFSYIPLEMLWGAFKKTYSFYFRYSFVFSFLLVVVAGHFMDELSCSEEKAAPTILAAPVALVALAGLELYSSETQLASWDWKYLTALCVVVVLVYVFYQHFGKKSMRMALVMLTIFLFADLGINAKREFSRYTITRAEYAEYVLDVEEVINEITESDSEFYRMEKTITEMDERRPSQTPAASESFVFNYNGITHYSSMYDSTVNNFLINTGYSKTNAKSVNYVESNLVMDSILGVKYLLSTRDDYTGLQQIGSFTCHDDEQVYVYENEYALSFATKIESTTIEGYAINPLRNQSRILDAMLGYESEVLVQLEYEYNDTDTWEIEVTQDGPVYLYMGPIGSNHKTTAIYVNGEVVEEDYFSRFYHYVIYAGEYSAGDTIEVYLEDDEGCTSHHYLYAYVIDMDNYEEAFTTLQENSVSPEIMEDDYVKLTWTAEEETEQILLSVPYDGGWDIYVNGEKVSYSKAYDTFITLTVEQGENVIEMKYFPPFLHHGMLVSAIGVLILAGSSVIIAVRKKRGGVSMRRAENKPPRESDDLSVRQGECKAAGRKDSEAVRRGESKTIRQGEGKTTRQGENGPPRQEEAGSPGLDDTELIKQVETALAGQAGDANIR